MKLKVTEGQVSLFDILNEFENNNKKDFTPKVFVSNEKTNAPGYFEVNIPPTFCDDDSENVTIEKFDCIFEEKQEYEKSTDIVNCFNLSDFALKVDLPFLNEHFISQLNKQQLNIIDKYKDSCSRIIQKSSGVILVEIDNSTLYFNSQNELDFTIPKTTPLLPSDKILVVNKDKYINQKQLDVLNDMKVTRCIKRIGDANIIICDSSTIVINPNGWVLDYTQRPCYNSQIELYAAKSSGCVDDDNTLDFVYDAISICSEENIKQSNVSELKEDLFSIGEIIKAKYNNTTILGTIKSIYNGGLTVNVEWDKKHTAFYIGNIKKINK